MQMSLTSDVAKAFLSACHSALLGEFEALTAEQRAIAAKAADLCFGGPESLLFPPEDLHSNTVVQSTNLYLHQILNFISYSLTTSSDSNQTGARGGEAKFVEAAGFCSGIISAIVASSFTGKHDRSFITTAVDGFRLCFWIGVRSAEFCQNNSTYLTDATPWSLTISGLSVIDVTRVVNEFNQTVSPAFPIIPGRIRLDD